MTFPILGGNSAVAGYSIDNSLRFNDNDSAYLSRTNASGGSRKIFTFSCWFKKSTLGSASDDQILFSSWDGSNGILIQIDSNDLLQVYSKVGGTVKLNVRSEMVFRDVSAFYHLVVKFDSNSTNLDLYVNGVEISQTVVVAFTDADHEINESGGTHYICSMDGSSRFWDGYLAETHYIDGTAKSPTDFGEFDEDSGIWKPKAYSGTYGTNGFYLDFENSGSLGTDQSGNGNNFTPTNLASTDQTTDTPTNNFATLNALQVTNSDIALSEGNVKQVITNNWKYTPATFGASSGKWYAEIKLEDASNFIVGVMQLNGASDTTSEMNTNNTILGSNSAGDAWGLYGSTNEVGTYKNNNTPNFGNLSSNFVGNWSNNDICMIALDTDNQKIWFGRNGSWDNSGDPSAGTNPMPVNTAMIAGETFTFAGGGENNTNLWNFGNPPFSISSGNSDGNGYGNFEYAPPSGYLALCTKNLATTLSPTIDDGSAYFHTQLYAGNGSTQSITNDAYSGDFKPDWLWIKERQGTSSHFLFDSTRGAGKYLHSNSTSTEGNDVHQTSFDTDGFSVGQQNGTNENNNTYVAWQWKANGGTTSSNTDGDVTSTVQVNSTAGFSITTFTGNSSPPLAVGHGLGVAPQVVLAKHRNVATHWRMWHQGLSGAGYYVILDLTNAQANSEPIFSGLPTSTTVGFLSDFANTSHDIVFYSFAEIEGYSKFGSYTGNGNANGTFIYTGFKPSFVISKRTNGTGAWVVQDDKRPAYNQGGNYVYANASNGEATDLPIDILSNGFKQRQGSFNDNNGSGDSYIYIAFASNPFVDSNGVPVTAR